MVVSGKQGYNDVLLIFNIHMTAFLRHILLQCNLTKSNEQNCDNIEYEEPSLKSGCLGNVLSLYVSYLPPPSPSPNHPSNLFLPAYFRSYFFLLSPVLPLSSFYKLRIQVSLKGLISPLQEWSSLVSEATLMSF